MITGRQLLSGKSKWLFDYWSVALLLKTKSSKKPTTSFYNSRLVILLSWSNICGRIVGFAVVQFPVLFILFIQFIVWKKVWHKLKGFSCLFSYSALLIYHALKYPKRIKPESTLIVGCAFRWNPVEVNMVCESSSQVSVSSGNEIQCIVQSFLKGQVPPLAGEESVIQLMFAGVELYISKTILSVSLDTLKI